MLIRKALERHGGNVSQAAKALGPEPERALPPAPASWALTGGVGPPVTSRGCSVAALLAGLPAVLVAGWLLWTGDHPLRIQVTLLADRRGAWLIGAALVRERVLRPLQTIANLLAALREGDYSIRARGASAGRRARASRCSR